MLSTQSSLFFRTLPNHVWNAPLNEVCFTAESVLLHTTPQNLLFFTSHAFCFTWHQNLLCFSTSHIHFASHHTRKISGASPRIRFTSHDSELFQWRSHAGVCGCSKHPHFEKVDSHNLSRSEEFFLVRGGGTPHLVIFGSAHNRNKLLCRRDTAEIVDSSYTVGILTIWKPDGVMRLSFIL